MNMLLIKILSCIEYISFWRILIIYEKDRSVTNRLIQALENTDRAPHSLAENLSDIYNMDESMARYFSQEMIRFYNYLESKSDSSKERQEMLNILFYIFSKRFPRYYSMGVISWKNLYRDLSLFDVESRGIRYMIKDLPRSISYLEQDTIWMEDTSELVKNIISEIFAGAVIKAVTLFNVLRFIKVNI